MSETQHYSPDPTLSPVQHQVLSLLAQGVSTSAAAAAAEIHRNTIANWRRTGPAFARELEFAAHERSMFWHDQAAALAEKAIAVLNEILDDKNASPALRLRAAFKVIAMASSPMKSIPASDPEPEATTGQDLFQAIANLHNSAQPLAQNLEVDLDNELETERPAQNCTNQPGRLPRGG
jgi:alpha-ketoglutarate-dependent taurine dioxygenase